MTQAAEQLWAHLLEHVHGQPAPLMDETIAECTDVDKLKKYYKLNGLAKLQSIKEPLRLRKEMELAVLGSMALKGL
jgi:EKC/KEOPS complex subunit CGI121/TPRKB